MKNIEDKLPMQTVNEIWNIPDKESYNSSILTFTINYTSSNGIENIKRVDLVYANTYNNSPEVWSASTSDPYNANTLERGALIQSGTKFTILKGGYQLIFNNDNLSKISLSEDGKLSLYVYVDTYSTKGRIAFSELQIECTIYY